MTVTGNKASGPRTFSRRSQRHCGDDNPNIFLDNLGKIFMATIGTVIVTLVRSSKLGSHKTALKEDVEHSTTLDPMEIDDLRCANSDWFTPKL